MVYWLGWQCPLLKSTDAHLSLWVLPNSCLCYWSGKVIHLQRRRQLPIREAASLWGFPGLLYYRVPHKILGLRYHLDREYTSLF